MEVLKVLTICVVPNATNGAHGSSFRYLKIFGTFLNAAFKVHVVAYFTNIKLLLIIVPGLRRLYSPAQQHRHSL